MLWVKVLYDFVAKAPGEISLKAGDVVEVTDSNGVSGWWSGKIGGK